MDVKLPVMDLYPRQRTLYDGIMDDSKHYACSNGS